MKRYIKQLSMCLLALCLGSLFNQCEKDYLVYGIAIDGGNTAVTTDEPTEPQKPEGDGICGTVSDYDGNEYDVVKLGTQEWMAQCRGLRKL